MGTAQCAEQLYCYYFVLKRKPISKQLLPVRVEYNIDWYLWVLEPLWFWYSL